MTKQDLDLSRHCVVEKQEKFFIDMLFYETEDISKLAYYLEKGKEKVTINCKDSKEKGGQPQK
jgi:hypothetical protein